MPERCWCPLNTRYKGAEAAYILRASGARILFTVQGFLGTDYPAMLDEAVAAGESVPDLERVVVLRTDGDDDVVGAETAGASTVGWAEFLVRGLPVRVRRGRRANGVPHAEVTSPTWCSPRGRPGTRRGR